MRIPLTGFTRFEKVEAAVEKLLTLMQLRLDVVDVNLRDSLNMVCAEDVRAPHDVPPFDRSAVDGYAVKSVSISSASPHNPVILRVVGTVDAGFNVSELRPLNEDEAYMVFTGAPIPPGADAVVPFEFCVSDGWRVSILRAVPPYANVSRAGEDFKAGDLIVSRGTRIMPWHISALASANITRVKVYRRVKVAIVNTGNELVELGAELSQGKIVNSTGLLIESYVKLLGAEPVYLGIVPDELIAIKNAIIKGVEVADIVVVTGGTSVGGKDLVPEAIEGIEGAIKVFHGVAMRPGRTTGAYVIRGKPVLILSGLPVACLVGLEVFLRPMINQLTNEVEPPHATIKGVLTRKLVNEVGFKSFYRVRVCYSNGTFYVEPLRLTGSGIISTLIKGNGLVVIPENVEGYDVGEVVDVKVINPIPRCDANE